MKEALAVALLVTLAGCGSTPAEPKRTLQSGSAVPLAGITLRLLPGDDPKKALEALVKERGIEAGFVVSAVGSLRKAKVRYADQKDATVLEKKLEVVSLSGLVSSTGGTHLHVSLADSSGGVVGGHLLDGGEVYTTLEVVLGVAPDLRYVREPDERSGYRELFVEVKSSR